MKGTVNAISSLIFLVMIGTSLLAFKPEVRIQAAHPDPETAAHTELKALAFQVLKTKCNACHKKENHMLIFNLRNMDKRAERINRMVYIEKRMPKGNAYNLTPEESDLLKRWLKSKKH